MNVNERIYHVNPKKVWKHFISLLIMFLGFTMFTWAMISSENSFWVDLILFIFAFLCLFYSCYLLVFLITTKLIISERGFSYSQPMYSVSSDWKHVKVRYLKDTLYLLPDEEFTKTNFSVIEKVFINQQNIWLNYFIDKFDNYKYWQEDPILIELQKYIPYLADVAREHFGNSSK